MDRKLIGGLAVSVWGPGLYQDDIAEDVKNYYKDQLHKGKTGIEITKALIKDNESILSDMDDVPIF